MIMSMMHRHCLLWFWGAAALGISSPNSPSPSAQPQPQRTRQDEQRLVCGSGGRAALLLIQARQHGARLLRLGHEPLRLAGASSSSSIAGIISAGCCCRALPRH